MKISYELNITYWSSSKEKGKEYQGDREIPVGVAKNNCSHDDESESTH